MRQNRKFYLFRRSQIFYVQFVDPVSKKRSCPRSTGCNDEKEAYATATLWLRDGIPQKDTFRTITEFLDVSRVLETVRSDAFTSVDAHRVVEALKARGFIDQVQFKHGKGSEDFITFLESFWTYETSMYVKEKHAHGQRIGRTHVYDMSNRIRVDWKPFFNGKCIGEVSRQDLKAFAFTLVKRGLAPATINKCMDAGTTALRWAFLNDRIDSDPTDGLMRFSGEKLTRDILNDDEADRLFSIEWKDERCAVASLIAMTCGLRLGEILALTLADIEETRLIIRHSWSPHDGLKCPKNGKGRQVPLLPHVRHRLLALAVQNPWGPGYIFYSSKENKPVYGKVILNGFKDALAKIGIDEEQRKSRNLVFHGLRHRYATKLADLVDARSLGMATGHLTPAMLEHYTDHANEGHFQAVMDAVKSAFTKVI